MQCFMFDHHLMDAPPKKGLFTWNNMRTGENLVVEHLNHFIFFDDLLNILTLLEALNLPGTCSDHWMIQLEINQSSTPKNFPFKWEKEWANHLNYSPNINSWWKEGIKNSGT